MIYYFVTSGLEDFANSLFGSINSVLASVFFANVLFFIDGVTLPLAVAWLAFAAVFLTIKMGFPNIRYFKHAIHLTLGHYDNAKSKGEVSHFKALATALSATVGLGNIAGVTIAIATGGPGATFWIIIAGLIGMSSKFAECTLAQMYRDTHADGHVLGGPMMYLKKGFAEMGWVKTGKVLAVFFALLCMCGAYGGGGSFQMNQSLYAIGEIFPVFLDHKWLYGVIMTFLVAIVILGGLKRIANVTDKIVPVMCGTYLLMGIYVLIINYSLIPSAFASIVSGAFSPDALYGGFLGVLVVGFRRAAFSNEAGMGSAAIAHSAAKVEYPVQEGMVALLEPFIDTVVVCTVTALMIVITGAYNNPQYIDLIHANNGAALTARALGGVNQYFPYLLAVIVFLFAYSTIISWSYYGDRAFAYLFGEKYVFVYKISVLIIVFLGAVSTSTNIMEFGDLIILGMGFPNLIGVYLLCGKVKIALKDYGVLLKSGKIVKTR